MPAAIPIVAAVASSAIASNASSKAAKTQAAAANHASDISESQYQQTRADQLKQYEQVRADQAPYRQVGQSSLNMLAQGMGVDTPLSYAQPETRDQISQRLTAQYTMPATQNSLAQQSPTVQQRPAVQSAALLRRARFNQSGDGEGLGVFAYDSPNSDTGRWVNLGSVAGAGQQQQNQGPVVDHAGLNSAVEAEYARQVAESQKMAPRGAGFGDLNKRFTLQDYEEDPGYQFRLQQGEQGINRAAAARGGWNSGATLKALAGYNSNMASQEYGNAYSRFNTDKTTQFNRLASLSGIGQIANTAVGNAGNNAYGTIASAGANNANRMANASYNAGEARASGYVGQSEAIGSGIKQLYDNYQQNQFMKNANSNGFGNAFTNMNDPAYG